VAKKRKTITRYRDKQTGKFVSKATWKRSRAHGGSRFRRERARVKRAPKKLIARRKVRPRTLPRPAREEIERVIEEEEEEETEYGGAFDSP
jgi:hypothetical protein